MRKLDYEPDDLAFPLPIRTLVYVGLVEAPLLVMAVLNELDIVYGQTRLYLYLGLVALMPVFGLLAWRSYRRYQRDIYADPESQRRRQTGQDLWTTLRGPW